MAVSNTNVALRSEIGNDGCKVVETANISLSSLMTGGNINGILNTFANTSTGGPCSAFEKIGGSNNPLQSTPNSNATTSQLQNFLTQPFHMSHAIGGDHIAGGGPGQ